MKKYEVVSPYVVFSVKDGAARKEYALKKGDTVELPENDIAVRAFVKQFRQQGYKNVRPILSGALSYGVEIETFESKEQAQAWINDKKAPDVKGLRVTNRLGEPSDKVDLVFRNLTEDQRQALFAIWKRWQGTEIQNCSFYQK